MQLRKVNPDDILLPPGFKIEVFAVGLTTPINMIFTPDKEILVADAGVISGNGKVLRLSRNGDSTILADGFKPPLTGINYHKEKVYVSHRGSITTVNPGGFKEDILQGLPSWGDHHNNQVVFGRDGKMYFGQGTATNSGVVGEDNSYWVKDYPYFHDYPGRDIILCGQNLSSGNFLTKSAYDFAVTGAYSPFNVPTKPYETVKGQQMASGSILRANPDGSCLELLAWGLRNPFRMKFDRFGRLFLGNHGMDVRGSRPVENSPDEFHLLMPGTWYGWPDYTGGLPLTLPMFKPVNGPQPQFLLARHPMRPPRPFAVFADHSAIMGFDFDHFGLFGPRGDAYIAEFGSEAPETTGGRPDPMVGHRVSRIDMKTGQVCPFVINKSGMAASESGSGGLERPIDVIIGPCGSMYIVDFSLNKPGEPDEFVPETGVVWRVIKA